MFLNFIGRLLWTVALISLCAAADGRAGLEMEPSKIVPRKSLSGPFHFTCRHNPPPEIQLDGRIALLAKCIDLGGARCDADGNILLDRSTVLSAINGRNIMPYCRSHCECTDDHRRAWADTTEARYYHESHYRGLIPDSPLANLINNEPADRDGPGECAAPARTTRSCRKPSDCGRRRPRSRWACDPCHDGSGAALGNLINAPSLPFGLCVLHRIRSPRRRGMTSSADGE